MEKIDFCKKCRNVGSVIMNMNLDCFYNAYKNPFRISSSLENFTTEMFVFVWRYLVESNPELAKELFDLFSIPVEDLSKVHFSTYSPRYVPYSDNDISDIKLEPNIMIWTSENEFITEEDELYFIMLEVESQLNFYKFRNEKFEWRIGLCEKIEKCKAVYTLAKNYVDEKNPDKKRRWYQVAELLKKDNSVTVKNFLKFLEENDMGEREPIRVNPVDILKNLQSLLELISGAWNSLGYNEKYCALSNPEIGAKEIGYYIHIKNKTEFEFWLGTIFDEENQNKLVLFVDRKAAAAAKILSEEIEWAPDRANFMFTNKLDLTLLNDLSSLVEKEDFQEQQKIVIDWLRGFDEVFAKVCVSENW